MPEVSVEEQTCGKCGAEVRRDTQFCYNCGESVGEEAIPAPSETSLNVDKTLAESTAVTDAANRNDQYQSTAEEPKLTSAASLRRKGRAPDRKRAEAVWEPLGSRVNLSLIISTAIFAIFTIIVILMALSSR